jgi:uncharacterized protein
MEALATIAADPHAPSLKVFQSDLGEHMLVVPHSRIFDLPDNLSADMVSLASALADPTPHEVPLDRVVAPAPQSISLNVSSSCNLACSYCYAARGSFLGAQPNPMAWDTAQNAIDRLLSVADPHVPITVGFLGGEPFANRRLIHRAVEYASTEANRLGLDVRFSVTTNGTLLQEEDIELLRAHRFAVTVSLDGGQRVQNLQRPVSGGKSSSFDLLCSATHSLLENPGLAQVNARATVKRGDFNLRDRFQAILSLGFPEAGFSPLRGSRTEGDALQDEDWPEYLRAMTDLARLELERAFCGEHIRFTNLAVALKQLYRGASSPYPCGAGGGYFSVGANGDWYACHRAIGSGEYRMGNNEGLSAQRRLEFLTTRHVHSQAACRQCWARYLCSGGCHQEASSRSESGCGFIRGWLEFCLAAYCTLTERQPNFFHPLVQSQEAQYG